MEPRLSPSYLLSAEDVFYDQTSGLPAGMVGCGHISGFRFGVSCGTGKLPDR